MPDVPSQPVRPAWRPLMLTVRLLASLAGAGVMTMVGVTCLDVVLRRFGHPIPGAYDIVRLAGGITMACALPITTALKGHVAIEFFFHKLNRRWRLGVDFLMRSLQMLAFVVAAHECWRYGLRLLRSGEVTPTLQWPTFWLAWVMALGCIMTALVTGYQL